MMKTSPNPYYLCLLGFSFICCFLLCPFLLEVVTVSFLSGSLLFSPTLLFGVPRKANSLIFPWKKTIWGQLAFLPVVVDVVLLIIHVLLRLLLLLPLLLLVLLLIFLCCCFSFLLFLCFLFYLYFFLFVLFLSTFIIIIIIIITIILIDSSSFCFT